MKTTSERPGISTSESEPIVANVVIGEDRFTFELEDGRTISAPFAWFPRLRDASPAQREKWTQFGDGSAIWWPEIDEHISAQGVLDGKVSYELIRERKAQ
ncbi:MAG: DUF2442 domain-containing protein [Verrucomicrobiota bacterium JB024]|nr:DUF2442 domain-containing protein [Verrucomicrobiota bacterium JB024]